MSLPAIYTTGAVKHARIRAYQSRKQRCSTCTGFLTRYYAYQRNGKKYIFENCATCRTRLRIVRSGRWF